MSKRGVPGNTLGETQELTKMLAALGHAMASAERVFDRYFDEDILIEAVRVRLPQYDGQEYLGVVSARQGDVYIVAFHSAGSFAECVRGMIARLDNRSLKFKEDTKRNGS